MQNKKFIIFISLVAVFFVLGFISARLYYFSFQGFAGANKQSQFEKGWQAAEDRLLQTGYIEPERLLPSAVKDVSGTIIAVNEKERKITVSINPISPLANADLDEREIMIDADTEMIRTSIRDDEAYSAEMIDFMQSENRSAVNSGAPSLFISETIQLNDLKPGDEIVVYTDEDIKDLKSFKAKKITSR